jgi:hypothetical protein
MLVGRPHDDMCYENRAALLSRHIRDIAYFVHGICTPLEARAGDAAAKTLVKAMSDYMAAQTAIPFSFDTDLEIVTKDKMKLSDLDTDALPNIFAVGGPK